MRSQSPPRPAPDALRPQADGPPSCPLCAEAGPARFAKDGRRTYWQCRRCALVFVAPGQRPDSAAEKARYDLHRNDPADEGYRRFLLRLVDPLLARVPAGAEGLDFGSGPAPVLASLLNERGRPTCPYDPYYAPDESVWLRTYDFITAVEVVEHLFNPGEEFERLFRVLRPGGWLGITTKSPPEPAAFGAWAYRRDATHVAFYSEGTFRYVATRWHAAPVFVGPDVILLRKGS